MRTFSDFVNLLKMAYYECDIAVRDPFMRNELEKKMQEMGIKYLKGYSDLVDLYSYSIIGTKGKKDKDLGELLEWFKGDDELDCFTTINELTRTKTYNFTRRSEHIDMSRFKKK